jgi:lysine 2,3-aminomutase
MPGSGPLIGRPEAGRRYPWLRVTDWAAVAARFPVHVPRAYVADASDPADPRLRTALPDDAELVDAPGDLPDPVGDAARSPLPWVVHKHPDRVLLLLTKRCHLYCRYCFRRNHQPGAGEDPNPAEWDAMLAYAAASGAHELILSGGDPLAVSDARLFEAIDRVAAPVVRVHTRAPITWPRRVTPALVEGLRARGAVWILVHVNHPVELSGPVRAAIGRLVDAGLPVLNQAVLLRGVNDDVDVLAKLSRELLGLRVFPYYLHHPDAAPGNAHFRVDPARGVALHRALRARTSGLGLPAYVIDLPDGSGKMPVEEWLACAGAVSSADGGPARDPTVS